MAISGIIRSPVRAIASSGLAGDQGLLGRATSILGGIEPLHYWDFTTNRALFNRQDVGGVANTPGWIFSGGGGAYYNSDGTVSTFGSGALRIGSRGLLIEETRTNLFLNSAVGVTQTVTVVISTTHTVSFRGTGTITLSGAFVGSLVGTGANNFVALTFTPATTSLTLTITGDVRNVNLEAKLSSSTWISTAGASATRNGDVLTVSSPGVDYPLTLWIEYERAVDSGTAVTLLRVDDGTLDERAVLGINGSDLARTIVADGAVTQADVTVAGALAVNTIYKQAGAVSTNRVQSCVNGTLGTEDTVATMPATPSIIRFGSSEVGLTQPFVYIRRAAVFNTALSNANLQAVTA